MAAYAGWEGSAIGLLEMEYEPVVKSTSSIAQSFPLSQRKEIMESGVSGMLNDPLKAGC